MKVCTKCKIEKPKTEFCKQKLTKDGIHPYCKACNVARVMAWREANPDRFAATETARHTRNAERIAEQRREYRKANPEKIAAIRRAYYLSNPEKILESNRNRRALKFSAEGTHTAKDIRSIFESQRGLCANCKEKLFKSGNKTFHVDHIIPLSKGGSNDKYNLQCLCPACNIGKHNKDPLDWARANDRLL